MKPSHLFVAMLGIAVCGTATADEYIRIGKAEASICSGFVIKSCEFKEVDAPAAFRQVSEYDSGKGRCWVNLGGGSISFRGAPVSGDSDYVTFKCKKR